MLAEQERAKIVLAAGESQMTYLDALARERNLDWKRVSCFNMDEFYDPRMPEKPTVEVPASIISTVEGKLYVDMHSCPQNLLRP